MDLYWFRRDCRIRSGVADLLPEQEVWGIWLMKRSTLHSHPRYLINRRRIPRLFRHKEQRRVKREQEERKNKEKEERQ